MRVLITGDTGFIGSRLSDIYKKKGAQVLGWGTDGVHEKGKKNTCKSLMEPMDIYEILDGYSPDLILHCAGSADVNRSVEKPLYDLKNNYITTHNLLFAMKKLQMHECRFIFMSSAAVYGNPIRLPVTEKQRTDPLSPYALHKKAAEDVCLYMRRNHSFDIKILRIFSAYGPGLQKQIFWDMYKKIMTTGKLDLLGSGRESRDFIYIDDLVRAIMLVAEKAPYEEIFYNVANGEEIEIKRAAFIFAKYWGIDTKNVCFTGKQREGDPINWEGDISKLLSLGYIREVSFEDGIKKYIKWVKTIKM